MKYLQQLSLQIALCLALVGPSGAIELPPLLDSSVRHGELANGVRYFIVHAKEPADKVEVQLLVNVGSLSETDQEQGFAHLLEHMAFRRTKNFGQGQVKAFVESEGMRIGHDTNAFTNHETTIYKLSVASAQANKAINLLSDWASGEIQFDATELAAEKKVVLDEGRYRAASTDFYAELMQKMYPASRYAQWLPIGEVKVIEQVSTEQIQAFYLREYQAQRMTVMIAGDVDVDAVESQIKTRFAGAKKGEAAREYPVPRSDQGLRLFSHRNVEWLAQPIVRWTWLQPVQSVANLDAAMGNFRHEMLAILLQQRLLSQSKKPDSTLMQSSAQFQLAAPLVPARHGELSVEAFAKGNQLKEALRELYRELERAQRFGFTEAEIKAAFELRQSLAPDQLTNVQWTSQMLQHVRYGDALRLPYESAYLRRQFNAATKPADYQQLLQTLLKDPNQLAYMLLPKQLSSFSLLTEQSVKSMVAEVQAEKLEPQSEVVVKALVANPPSEGKIIKREPDQATGGRLLTLSNGIEVLTVPGQTNRVGFAAIAKGGLLALDRKLWPAGRVANQYLLRAGLGDLTFNEVNQALQSKGTVFMPLVNIDQFAWLGEAPSVQLETLLQMQYLAFTSRRQDDAERKISSDLYFQNVMVSSIGLVDYLNARRYGENWPLPQYWRKNDVDADLKQLNEVREIWLKNPAQFRFVLTGIDNHSQYHEQLIERYIGGLPTQPQTPVTLPHLGMVTPAAFTQPVNELKGAVRVMQVSVQVPPSSESAVLTDALAELVRLRLNAALRESAGETYSVNVWTSFTESQGALINVLFQNDTAKCSDTEKIVETELRRLLSEAASEKELQAVRDKITKTVIELPQRPMLYANLLATHRWLNQDKPLAKLPDLAEYTPDMLFKYTQAWLAPGNWTSGVFNCRNEIDFSKLKSPAMAQ
ncbi:insulinase family protein [Chitinibacter fontanus]|uniref:Insulinase family protein n=1 Tax=Chitinibacter fontanus TaxID=1737446 RepID=A0A7D5VBP3_9NEIS|nr:insulinase family protein [Chitinibacter fontanus]QLI82818.1 insulinase family protein [Chitinibacter fontanus]